MISLNKTEATASMLERSILTLSVCQFVYFLFNVRQPRNVLRTASKTGATALLALFTASRNGVTAPTLALALGSLGDYFLAITDTHENFIRGLSSFLLAHLLYIKILLDATSGFALIFDDIWRLVVLFVMVIVAPGMNFLMLLRINANLRIPIVVYSAAIFVMFVSALCVEDIRITIGAILFTVSDSLLATDRFLLAKGSKHAPWMQYAVWVFYYTGQLLLSLGLSL